MSNIKKSSEGIRFNLMRMTDYVVTNKRIILYYMLYGTANLRSKTPRSNCEVDSPQKFEKESRGYKAKPHNECVNKVLTRSLILTL